MHRPIRHTHTHARSLAYSVARSDDYKISHCLFASVCFGLSFNAMLSTLSITYRLDDGTFTRTLFAIIRAIHPSNHLQRLAQNYNFVSGKCPFCTFILCTHEHTPHKRDTINIKYTCIRCKDNSIATSLQIHCGIKTLSSLSDFMLPLNSYAKIY